LRNAVGVVARVEPGAGEFSATRSVRPRLEFDLIACLVLAGRRWRTRLNEDMKAHQQTDARWGALYGLADSPDGVIQSELADRLGVKGPSLVKLLDALEGQGLVSRRAAAGDRRANQIVLEPRGREVLAEVDEVASRLRADTFEVFTDEELRVTRSVLDRLARRLEPA
jgi:MarR family transcriptional regulator for hemolysin